MPTTQALTKEQKEARRKRQYARDRSAEEAEIGPPEISDAHRKEGDKLRELCRGSLLEFNKRIFPNSTGLKPFGDIQLDSIAKDEVVITSGGRVCKAEPRGYGKTSRGCNAALKAVLYGHRRMVPVFSANMDKSKSQVMERWKTELYGNEQLYWMFPDLLWPLRRLENKPQRCASQTMDGRPTNTKWTADRIVLPDVPGYAGAGAILIALPLKSCRGATHTMPDGTILRPELCIFDDVQKDEDADNPNTVRKLRDLIDHTAMMLGGHSRTMSAIMNCTVRQPDDLSEVYLNKVGWLRVRYKMLRSRAKREADLWLDRYATIRRDYDPEDAESQKAAHRKALAFYLDNRAEMDEGAEVTWEWAYAWDDDEPTEASAIQHAYNILIDEGESVFASECQNEPIRDTGGLVMLTPKQIRAKQSGYPMGTFPSECQVLTCKVDVHPEILYWEAWAWEPCFTGYLFANGTFPEQPNDNFSHNSVARSLSRLYPGYDEDATITAGLEGLLHGAEGHVGLMQREWTSSGGVPMRLAAVDVDANGRWSEAIKKWIRTSPHAGTIYPTFGRGVTARQAPISRWQQSKGKNTGPEWAYTKPQPGEPRGVIFDTNYWKTRFHQALALPPGSKGALYVYSVDSPERLRRISEHWTAERPKEVVCGNRVVYEFPQDFKGDNHDFDCAVGAMVAASKLGITTSAKRRRKGRGRPTLSQLAGK